MNTYLLSYDGYQQGFVQIGRPNNSQFPEPLEQRCDIGVGGHHWMIDVKVIVESPEEAGTYSKVTYRDRVLPDRPTGTPAVGQQTEPQRSGLGQVKLRHDRNAGEPQRPSQDTLAHKTVWDTI